MACYTHRGIKAAAVAAIAIAIPSLALAQSRSDPPPRGFEALGDRAMPSDRIEFVNPNQDFPPRPRGFGESLPVRVEPVETLSQERLQAAERVAADNPQVRKALGRRFVNLVSGPAEVDKAGGRQGAALVRLYG